MKKISISVGAVVVILLVLFWLSSKNFGVCRFLGGEIKSVSTGCFCHGDSCAVTTCGNKNYCMINSWKLGF